MCAGDNLATVCWGRRAYRARITRDAVSLVAARVGLVWVRGMKKRPYPHPRRPADGQLDPSWINPLCR